jgi:alanine dehydrogenase
MTIGIPKEIKEQEQRVGLLPSTAQSLVGRGHTVLVQKNAGVGSGYPDEEYVKAGAQSSNRRRKFFSAPT